MPKQKRVEIIFLVVAVLFAAIALVAFCIHSSKSPAPDAAITTATVTDAVIEPVLLPAR